MGDLFWLLITVFADVFRRHDIGGGAKVLWLIFVIILPFLGVLHLSHRREQGDGGAQLAEPQPRQRQFNDYVQNVAASSSGGAAAEIEKAKGLLDSGAITQSEYDAIKQKALAG